MNIHANLQILYKAQEGPTLNILEQFEIYEHYKTQKLDFK